MKYITRTDGATVTVMVPWDCKNKCPFCINKAEYEDQSSFNFDEVVRSIKIMSVMTPNCDFVFTGGEPLADLKRLEVLITAVHQIGTNHKVFINTTLPTNQGSTEEKLADYLNCWYDNGLITGINVSRHLLRYVSESDDRIFSMLHFEARINCVLYYTSLAIKDIKEQLINFVSRFKKVSRYIQFRADYVTTTPENLYVKGDEDAIFNLLNNIFSYKGTSGEYRMRVGYEFEDSSGFRLSYHRTLPYSKIYIKNDAYCLYDIIIKQSGDIKEDWDTCTTGAKVDRVCDNLALDLDLSAYRKVVYEVYK